jgi:hypothetical protein
MKGYYMKTLCTNCWGGLVAHAREKLLRSQGKPVVCMECGDAMAKERKFTVACNNKQGYELITDLSHLKQLNPKRTI